MFLRLRPGDCVSLVKLSPPRFVTGRILKKTTLIPLYGAAFHSDTERAAGRQAAELRGTPSTHHCLGVRVTSDFCQRASEVSCPGAPDADMGL